jgi:hypothetical protein
VEKESDNDDNNDKNKKCPLCRAHLFECDECDGGGWKIENYVKYEYVKQPWFEAMPELMQEAVKEYLGWHLLVKAKKL